MIIIEREFYPQWEAHGEGQMEPPEGSKEFEE